MTNHRVNRRATQIGLIKAHGGGFDAKRDSLVVPTDVPSSGSAFSLLPAQNATGNWIKVVQRLPVRIKLDPQELANHPLAIGLSMLVDVDIKDESGSPLSSIENTVYQTDVFAKYGNEADAEIARIVAANR